MRAHIQFRPDTACRKIKTLIGMSVGAAIILTGTAALAAPVVSTTGCANVNVSCTLQELGAGGTITVNSIQFSNFIDIGFGGANIVVTPFGSSFSDLTAGLNMEPLDLENNPWRIASTTQDMLLVANLEYDVTVLAGDPIVASTLLTTYGQLVIAGTSFIDGVASKRVYRPGFETIDLAVGCNDLDPLYCGYLTGVDSESFEGTTLLNVDESLLLEFELVSAMGGAIEAVRIANEFRRVPSPELTIVSSSAWKSSDTFVPGWATIGFNDGVWNSARAPYPSPIDPTDLIPGTTAQFIWHDPEATSDGQTGPIEAFMRLRFGLDLIDINAPFSAIARVSVDDDYDLYVNGELVLENHDNGFGDQVDTIDIAPYLHHGANVIGIHGVDGGWNNAFNRGYERALIDVAILPSPYISVPILSGSDWLSSEIEEENWQAPEFNDSAWPPARAPYPGVAAATLITDTAAQAIWHDPNADYDGTNGPIQAFFRYHFDIPYDLQAWPIIGRLHVNADDDYDLYVNGTLVHENHDNGFSTAIQLVDITAALRAGQNVIAIQAVDGGWNNPRDRGSERLIVDGLVASGDVDFIADTDGDGFVDQADNCTLHTNSAQSDTNGDDYGNACDPDLNGDLAVNFQDLELMENVFFSTNIVSDADLNNDTNVNFADLTIVADFIFGSPGPSALARPGLVFVQETDNTRASAFNASRLFALNFDADVFDSTTVPHASLVAEIDSADDIDWYAFTVLSSGAIFLDIDEGWDPTSPFTTVDTMLFLFDSNGTLLAWSDTSSADPGSGTDPDFGFTYDPFIGVYAPSATPGVYYVAVSSFPNYAIEAIVDCDPGVALTRPDAVMSGGLACPASAPGNDTFTGGSSDTGTYFLHISNTQPIPMPSQALPFGVELGAYGFETVPHRP